MGINIEVTSVDVAANSIAFTQDGQAKTGEVIAPAKIQWAKVGKAEVGITPEGKINFIKRLEPRQAPAYSGYKKPDSGIRAVSTLKVLEEVSPAEAVAVYDNINATKDTKCSASTPFLKESGKYDVWFYVTTFVPKGSVVADETEATI